MLIVAVRVRCAIRPASRRGGDRRQTARSTGRRTRTASGADVWMPRFSAFSSSNSSWNARSRLNACTIAMPATDSATCAVTAAIRFRTSSWATADVRWNQRVSTSAGGSTMTTQTMPSRQSTTNSTTTRSAAARRLAAERRQALRQRVRRSIHVAGQAGDDPAGALLGEVPKRQRRQVVEQVAAQAQHDPLTDHRQATDQHGAEQAQPTTSTAR